MGDASELKTTLCAYGSLFVQQTVSPGATLIVAGENPKPIMLTICVPGAHGASGVGCAPAATICQSATLSARAAIALKSAAERTRLLVTSGCTSSSELRFCQPSSAALA